MWKRSLRSTLRMTAGLHSGSAHPVCRWSDRLTAAWLYSAPQTTSPRQPLKVANLAATKQVIGKAVEVDHPSSAFILGIHQRHDSSFGTATDSPGHVKSSCGHRAARKDEILERLKRGFHGVDGLFKVADPFRRNSPKLIAPSGSSQLRSQIEQVVLNDRNCESRGEPGQLARTDPIVEFNSSTVP